VIVGATAGERTPWLYRAVQLLAPRLWRLRGKLDVIGLENVPTSGPFLLIANHQSVLDPIFIQSVVPRPVYAMAKSTQFAVPFLGPLMPRILAFPVRRYQVDPQSVRIALRLLREGRGVAIYIEGERTWNGLLQEPRRGTVRLALRAGVPIIPTAVRGTYNAWPRWDRKPGPAAVTIRFLPGMRLPVASGAENRALVPETARAIMAAIRTGL
jgi:1-acyl-sn-glycerol-3-phosphate acyltransferase